MSYGTYSVSEVREETIGRHSRDSTYCHLDAWRGIVTIPSVGINMIFWVGRRPIKGKEWGRWIVSMEKWGNISQTFWPSASEKPRLQTFANSFTVDGQLPVLDTPNMTLLSLNVWLKARWMMSCSSVSLFTPSVWSPAKRFLYWFGDASFKQQQPGIKSASLIHLAEERAMVESILGLVWMNGNVSETQELFLLIIYKLRKHYLWKAMKEGLVLIYPFIKAILQAEGCGQKK